MSALHRWLRFNLVGLLGFAVQLGSLALLHRAFPRHNLYCSVAALELTLLHNFAWHSRFTWRAPAATLSGPSQLLRFHAANGLVSLCGNVAGVWLLTRLVHAPLVVANAIAILACSIANFYLADRWTFRPPPPGPRESAPGPAQAAHIPAESAPSPLKSPGGKHGLFSHSPRPSRWFLRFARFT